MGKEMENISRGPTYGDFVTILTERSMQQDITVARPQEYRLPSPRLFKVGTAGSPSVDSQNILCATLREGRGQGWGSGSASGSGFNRVSGSGSGLRIRIQEGKNDPKK
jgi:hypothetical protein